jgi:hypothetical protein
MEAARFFETFSTPASQHCFTWQKIIFSISSVHWEVAVKACTSLLWTRDPCSGDVIVSSL